MLTLSRRRLAVAMSTSDLDSDSDDEEAQRLRVQFSRFRSTIGLWAWLDDYQDNNVHMRDMLDRALVIDVLVEIGALPPKDQTEFNYIHPGSAACS